MFYCIDCRHWIAGLTLVVSSAEALKRISELQSAGCPVDRVATMDGVSVTLFELRLLAERNPILAPRAN